MRWVACVVAPLKPPASEGRGSGGVASKGVVGWFERGASCQRAHRAAPYGTACQQIAGFDRPPDAATLAILATLARSGAVPRVLPAIRPSCMAKNLALWPSN